MNKYGDTIVSPVGSDGDIIDIQLKEVISSTFFNDLGIEGDDLKLRELQHAANDSEFDAYVCRAADNYAKTARIFIELVNPTFLLPAPVAVETTSG